MVSLKVFNSVGQELRRIEQAYDVRVLYACESGSRAWGFASQDSDYDVRFLYVHSRDWCLSIEDRRDMIEARSRDNKEPRRKQRGIREIRFLRASRARTTK